MAWSLFILFQRCGRGSVDPLGAGSGRRSTGEGRSEFAAMAELPEEMRLVFEGTRLRMLLARRDLPGIIVYPVRDLVPRPARIGDRMVGTRRATPPLVLSVDHHTGGVVEESVTCVLVDVVAHQSGAGRVSRDAVVASREC